MVVEIHHGNARSDGTLLKEAVQHVGSKYVDQVFDSLYVIEMGAPCSNDSRRDRDHYGLPLYKKPVYRWV